MKEKYDYRPISFWSMNGKLEKETIIHQIEEMSKQGYGGFFLHARAGLQTEYLSEAWFEAIETAVAAAEKEGMYAWLYDENGWPSGFAGGLVPDLGDSYTASHICFSYTKPGKNLFLAAYRVKDGNYQRIGFSESVDGDLFCYKEFLAGYADILNPAAVEAFIGFTHEKYKEKLGKYFGNVIPGIFTDEPQLTGKYAFTDSLANEFSSEYNMDFFDQAWQLYVESEESYSFRYKTARIISKMLLNHYTKKLNDWCKDNHLIFTGHFPCEDGLCAQNGTTFGVMMQYDEMERPGIDFLGRRLISPVAIKQVSDAAFFSGKKMITSESFGCCGWDVSFADLMWIAAYQAVFGINSIVTHLSAYSIKGRRKRDYPAFFSEQEPWWNRFSVLTNEVKRINEFLSEGVRVPKIAVIHPMSSMWCVSGGTAPISDKAKSISNQFRLLLQNLNDLQKDYVLITESNFATLKNEGSELCGKNCRFDIVIVPDSFSLEEKTIDLLSRFSANGGRLIFINQKPDRLCGVISRRIEEMKSEIVQNRRELIYSWFAGNGIADQIEVLDPNSKRNSSGILMCVKHLDDSRRIMLFNPDRNSTKKCLLRVNGKYSVVLDNGQYLKTVFDGESTFADISLAPAEYCLCSVTQKQEKTSVSYSPLQTTYLTDFTVLREESNILTVDKCDIFINDKLCFKEENPVEKCDDIYRLAYKSGELSQVRLIYRFRCEFEKNIPDDLRVAAETDGCLTINGQEIPDDGGFFLDRDIKTYPVGKHIKNGENLVEITFSIIRPDEVKNDSDFEGYRNIFFYEYEPESIYVLGNFGVKMESGWLCDNESMITSGNFSISDETKLVFDELTSQGNWFYRGNYELKTNVTLSPGQYSISFNHFGFTLADVFINDCYAGTVFKEPYEVNISDFLIDGENQIKIILYGSNRNALGPHHHMMKNPHFVGVSSFKGETGFCDFIYPQITGDSTKISDYCFVRANPRGIVIKKYDVQ